MGSSSSKPSDTIVAAAPYTTSTQPSIPSSATTKVQSTISKDITPNALLPISPSNPPIISSTSSTDDEIKPINHNRPAHYNSDLSSTKRVGRQLTLYLAGATFLLLSTRLARRSMQRRYVSITPKYYTHNSHQKLNFNGGQDAFEALSIATMGVMSIGMIVMGGSMFALDVVNVEELRDLSRIKFGGEDRKSDQEVEEELEEWVATILSRKDQKDKGKQNTSK